MNLWKAAKRAHATASKHGFWDGVQVRHVNAGWHDPQNLDVINRKLMLIISEVTEAMEEHRSAGRANNFGNFGNELADVVIRTLDLAGFLGVDLEARVRTIMDTNDSRPVLHGGKKF